MDCIVRKIKRFSGIDKKSFYNSIHCTHALTMVQQWLYQVQIELFWITMKILHAFALKDRMIESPKWKFLAHF